MKVYTIGFTKKPASRFFELLRESGAKCLMDIRLNNVSQLAGYTKRDDLAYFVQEICGMQYEHMPDLAPTQEILGAYRNEHKNWDTFENAFLSLMKVRGVEKLLLRRRIANACLLCSEDQPEHCHRRLVAEYLGRHWGDIEIIHLT